MEFINQRNNNVKNLILIGLPEKSFLTLFLDAYFFLLNNKKLAFDRNKLKSQRFCLISDVSFQALFVEFFLIGKNSLIICFAGFNQMEHDPCEFVGGSRNCFWGSMPGSHTTEKMAQDRLTLPESLGRKP